MDENHQLQSLKRRSSFTLYIRTVTSSSLRNYGNLKIARETCLSYGNSVVFPRQLELSPS